MKRWVPVQQGFAQRVMQVDACTSSWLSHQLARRRPCSSLPWCQRECLPAL